MKSKLFVGWLAGASLLWSSAAGAVPVIIGIEGHLAAMASGAAQIGDPLRAFYIYDSSAIGSVSPPGSLGPYPTTFGQEFQSTGLSYGIFGLLGSAPFAMSGVTIQVTNDVHWSATVYSPCWANPPPSPKMDGYRVVSDNADGRFYLDLYNCDASAYDVADYPMGVPSAPTMGSGAGEFLYSFGTVSFSHDGSLYGGYIVIDRLYRVPEPSTLVLLIIGLTGLSLSRRRKVN